METSTVEDATPTRVALVTGARGGIGRAVVARLAAEGIEVVATDRDEPVAGDASSLPEGAATYLAADLTQSAACSHLIDQVVERHGRIDVLVNNAGFQHVSPVAEFPDDIWDAMTAVMLDAPFRLAKHAWRHLEASGSGRIVNIASIHALVASPLKSAYVASKHGLLGLTRVLALEGGPAGITANAICPGYVRTPLVEGQLEDQARLHGIPADEVVDRVMLEPAAIKRLVEPDEVAEMVAYLCGPHTRSISGAALTMDGAWTAR
ncbi:MAG: 3-hydroxybutyrate dehydrogenase [Nitriliruptoraceae bacterium]